MHADIWFDGACSGNPGPMGAGAVVVVAGKSHTYSRAMGHGTNNEAEYHGAILGLLQAQAAGATSVRLHGDSQLVLRQLQGRYQVKAPNLRALHADAKRLLARFARHELVWVRRDENAAADAAARAALQ